MQILAQQKEFQKNNDDNLGAEESDKRISRWIDDGYWLSWIIGLLFLIRLLKINFHQKSTQFNSNAGLFFILLTASSITSFNLKAESWDATWNNLWNTKDQQAQRAFEQKDYKKSASLFESDNWKASANYKSDDFESAVSGFSKGTDADSFYNRANALAKSQKLKEAIESYDNTLALEPEHEDAIFNKKIVEEMLKQQQEQKNKDQEKKDKEEQDKEEQDKKEENKDQSDSDSDEKKEEGEKSEEEKQQEQKDKENQEQQEKEAEISEDQRNKNEKDQALKHWLEKIPDDPGGLLRRKMYREYQRRGREQKEKKVW
jgi:Ca-activated chloride channel family protein